MTRKIFHVIRDGHDYLVADASVCAVSFAMIPQLTGFASLYANRAEAVAAAKQVNAMDDVPTRMIETPDRFEAVADTKYGPAWD